MRILHISSARSLGGGERHLIDLVCALAGRGHEVYVALPKGSPLRAELAALPAERVFTLRLRNALDLKSALELARLMREHQIEILHAHVARDYPLAALAASRAPQAKLVITRHVLFPLKKLHAVTARRVSRVIAVSRAVERVLLTQKIFPAGKIRLVPNGIDFLRLEAGLQNYDREIFRRRRGIEPGHLLVGTIGELRRQKGHEDFLRAAAVIARDDANVRFIIAGADASPGREYGAALARLACELGLTERVHFTGWVEEVGPLLAALDLYVSASHTESFGLSIVEAMGVGLPVVATATEGAREILKDGEAGALVRVGDYEALAATTLRLLRDENERARRGTHARADARALFSLERMVDQTEKLYFEAINNER